MTTLTSNEFLTTRIYGDLSTHGWTGRAGETYSGNMYVANDLRVAGNFFIPNNTFYVGNDLDVGGNIILSGNLVDYNGNSLLNPVSSSIPSGTNQGDFLSWDGSAWSVADSSICIGNQSGNVDLSNLSVGIGNQAGQGQKLCGIAIGNQAATNSQGTQCIAIGLQAGCNSQYQNCIAIGAASGYESQGNNAIAIGVKAGQYYQGNHAIAIGNIAGTTNQSANSIIVNGTGQHLAGQTQGCCYIAPIRNTVGTGSLLYYDSTNKEVYTYPSFLPTGINFTTNPVLTSTTTLSGTQSGCFFICKGSTFNLTFPNNGNNQCSYFIALYMNANQYVNFYAPTGKVFNGTCTNTGTNALIQNVSSCTLSNQSVGLGPTSNLIAAFWDLNVWWLYKIS